LFGSALFNFGENFLPPSSGQDNYAILRTGTA